MYQDVIVYTVEINSHYYVLEAHYQYPCCGNRACRSLDIRPFLSIWLSISYSGLAELHGDLFSCHASPLEDYVFVAVDERGEGVMPDEIGRRNNEKQEMRRRGGRSVQLPNWVIPLEA